MRVLVWRNNSRDAHTYVGTLTAATCDESCTAMLLRTHCLFSPTDLYTGVQCSALGGRSGMQLCERALRDERSLLKMALLLTREVEHTHSGVGEREGTQNCGKNDRQRLGYCEKKATDQLRVAKILHEENLRSQLGILSLFILCGLHHPLDAENSTLSSCWRRPTTSPNRASTVSSVVLHFVR